MGKKIIKISIILLFIFFIIPMIITVIAYNMQLNHRMETSKFYKYELEDFKNLTVEKVGFSSNKGQKLAGFIYKNDKALDKSKGVIVFAHGLWGGGHNRYLPELNYLAEAGYTIFTYDCTGNDESEGDGIIGLQQGQIDLHYALNYIEDNNLFENMPLMLYGHSWGGYSVLSVLNYNHDIKAVVERSGFNNSEDAIMDEVSNKVGKWTCIITPYVDLYERIKFGKAATYNGEGGLEKSDAAVMFIHSKDDDIISYDNSFKVFQEEFKERENFKFISFDNAGHESIINSDYREELDSELQNLSNEYNGEENIPEDKVKEFNKKAREKAGRLNMELMNEIIEFYNEHYDD